MQLNMIWPEGWQAIRLSKKWDIPFVISDNWTGYHPHQRAPLPMYKKIYMKWVANQASLLLPVTHQLESAMRRLGFKAPSLVIPNVVNTDYFKKGSINDPIHYLHLSHLDNNHKNVSGMLRAWKSFSASHPNAIFHIGGDGDSSIYQVEAAQLELSNILFFGSLNQEQVALKMQECDVFVLFSNYENLPLVMIEAMACGLLVIATDVGGVKEHITEKLGHQLIQPRDIAALESAFNLAHQNAATRNQDAIIAYAVDHFSYSAVGKAFMNAYEKVWNN
jgi:glycosyltransferase involved in cell wall biosynthesis